MFSIAERARLWLKLPPVSSMCFRIKDATGRRPDHPDYDPSTLFIPSNWFKEAKVSEAQQQWWNFKKANFNSVLLFKVGKFYEVGPVSWQPNVWCGRCYQSCWQHEQMFCFC